MYSDCFLGVGQRRGIVVIKSSKADVQSTKGAKFSLLPNLSFHSSSHFATSIRRRQTCIVVLLCRGMEEKEGVREGARGRGSA